MTRTPILGSLLSRGPWFLAAVVALGSVAACKGEKVIQPDPQTKADLDQCLKDKAEKNKLIKAEEEENARLMLEKGTDAEITVSIEGNMLTVKPGKPGEVRPLDDKVVGDASKE